MIVGSGFSRSIAGFPVQGAFWKDIERYIEASGAGLYHDALVERLKHSVRYESHFPNLDYNNIEQVFTVLHDITNFSGFTIAKIAAKDLTIFYRLMIVECFRQAESKVDLDWASNRWTQFIARFPAATTHWISTNYDEILERLLGIVSHYSFDKLAGICQPQAAKNSIIKLHGSRTWWEKRSWDSVRGQFATPDSGPEWFKESNEKNWGRHPLQAGMAALSSILNRSDELALTAYTPAIIPFFWQKIQWYSEKWRKVFQPIFIECARLIADADHILLLGYGLPDADWPLISMLTSNVMCKVTLIAPPDGINCDHRECNCGNISDERRSSASESRVRTVFKSRLEWKPYCVREFLHRIESGKEVGDFASP